MNASAQAHAAPVHAGGQGGPAASGSSLAGNRRKATRERTPIATEFVLPVRTDANGSRRVAFGAAVGDAGRAGRADLPPGGPVGDVGRTRRAMN